jgi:eukaryotic-like serine/threonine-protein kinase
MSEKPSPESSGPTSPGAFRASKKPAQIGRFQIIERVGAGSRGAVYRAIDPMLDREVAIKVMIADFGDDLDVLRPRFQREARCRPQ